jgi:hypothetical protein
MRFALSSKMKQGEFILKVEHWWHGQWGGHGARVGELSLSISPYVFDIIVASHCYVLLARVNFHCICTYVKSHKPLLLSTYKF